MSVKKKQNSETVDPVQQLGAELRALRKVHRLTLQSLAEKSGKSVSFLSKIERGVARPSVTALQEIAEALGVPVGWFFETDGPTPADERPFVVRAERRRCSHPRARAERLGGRSQPPLSTRGAAGGAA